MRGAPFPYKGERVMTVDARSPKPRFFFFLNKVKNVSRARLPNKTLPILEPKWPKTLKEVFYVWKKELGN